MLLDFNVSKQPNVLLARGVKVVHLTSPPQRVGARGEIEVPTKQKSTLGVVRTWKIKKEGAGIDCDPRQVVLQI